MGRSKLARRLARRRVMSVRRRARERVRVRVRERVGEPTRVLQCPMSNVQCVLSLRFLLFVICYLPFVICCLLFVVSKLDLGTSAAAQVWPPLSQLWANFAPTSLAAAANQMSNGPYFPPRLLSPPSLGQTRARSTLAATLPLPAPLANSGPQKRRSEWCPFLHNNSHLQMARQARARSTQTRHSLAPTRHSLATRQTGIPLPAGRRSGPARLASLHPRCKLNLRRGPLACRLPLLPLERDVCLSRLRRRKWPTNRAANQWPLRATSALLAANLAPSAPSSLGRGPHSQARLGSAIPKPEMICRGRKRRSPTAANRPPDWPNQAAHLRGP